MRYKKVFIGALALALLVGGTYYVGQGTDLQGRFSGRTGTGTSSTTVTPTAATIVKPDFYFKGAITYNDGLNYFDVSVCQTNVVAANVKQTSVKFKVSGGQDTTVEFTPTTTTTETCQTVSSGDLLSKLLINESGSYSVTATLDSTSVQTEKLETNNTLTSSVTAESDYYLYDSSDLPDITVENVSYDTDTDALLVKLCGVGEALRAYPSKGDLYVTYSVSTDNGTIFVDTSTGLSSPFSGASGAESCKEFSIDLDGAIGGILSGRENYLIMSVIADTRETTPESNEDNNGFDQSFTQEFPW